MHGNFQYNAFYPISQKDFATPLRHGFFGLMGASQEIRLIVLRKNTNSLYSEKKNF